MNFLLIHIPLTLSYLLPLLFLSFCTLCSLLNLLQILIQPICQHHISMMMMMVIFTYQLLSPYHFLNLLPLLLLFCLLLLPLLICYLRHHFQISLSFSLFLFMFSLLLILHLLCNHLLSLLYQTLLQPLFKHSITSLLLYLFL